MKKKQSGKPKEAPRAARKEPVYMSAHLQTVAEAREASVEAQEILKLCKAIALETRASLEQTTSVLAQMKEQSTATEKTLADIHNVGVETIDEIRDTANNIEEVFETIREFAGGVRFAAYLKSHVEEVRHILGINAIERRPDPPEQKICGHRSAQGYYCNAQLGHVLGHFDGLGHYWPRGASDAPESFPGPKAGQ
jgi:hypothetical protein